MTIAALRAIQDEVHQLTTAQLFEDVERLMSSCSAVVIAQRLSMEMEAIEIHCRRHGRLELAQLFNRAILAQRRLDAGLAQEVDQGHVDLWE